MDLTYPMKQFIVKVVSFYLLLSFVACQNAGKNDLEIQNQGEESTAPITPEVVQPISGDQQCILSWKAIPGKNVHNIYWSTTPLIEYVDENKLEGSYEDYFRHTDLVNGNTYYYAVTSINETGESAPSKVISCTPLSIKISKIEAGFSTLAIDQFGMVWVWGRSISSFLGHNYVNGGSTASNPYLPIPVCDSKNVPCTSFLSNVKDIAVGLTHLAVLKTNGTVWTWGTNYWLGIGSNESSSTPVQVCASQEVYPCSEFLTDITSISAGNFHTLALKNDGTVYAWGKNQYGELGDGTTTGALIPVQVCAQGEVAPCSQFISAVSRIEAGNNSSFAIVNGNLFSWGNNSSGQLGFNSTSVCGTVECSIVAQQIPGIDSVIEVSSDFNHTVALKMDTTVWAWGDSSSGKLGGSGRSGGNIGQVCAPGQSQPCTVFLENIVNISAGFDRTIAVDTNGNVWQWGNTSIFPGQPYFNPIPIPVSGLSNIVEVSRGHYYTVALNNDGEVFSWGFNINRDMTQDTAKLVKNVSSVISIAAGDGFAVANKTDGSVWQWGREYEFHRGYGTNSTYSTPETVNVSNITSVYASTSSILALTSLGTISTWGSSVINASPYSIKQVCDAGTSYPCNQFLSNVKSIANGYRHTMAVKENGTVWSWGVNDSGQLGNNTKIDNYGLVPEQVCDQSINCADYISDVKMAAGGWSHSVVLNNDGSVWSWGSNEYGQLGSSEVVESTVPTQVCEQVVENRCNKYLNDVSAISAGYLFTLALKNDGTVWIWGKFNNLSSIVESPVQVCNSLHNPCDSFLSGVIQLSAGSESAYVLKDDGSVWSWGNNMSGQLGNGNITYSKIPVQVCEDNNGLHCKTYLTDVVALTSAKRGIGVFSSNGMGYGGEFALALKSDGTVWSWGNNMFGQLGDASTIVVNTPTSVKGF